MNTVKRTKSTKRAASKSKSPRVEWDKRRKHHHWKVTVVYQDGEKFGRVYIDRDRAVGFAERQKKSPVVKSARIVEVN